MVSKKISKNDENEEITEEEKNVSKQMYLEAQQNKFQRVSTQLLSVSVALAPGPERSHRFSSGI